MTTTQAALVLAVIAAAVIVAGAAVLWGLGVALLVGGVLGLAARHSARRGRSRNPRPAKIAGIAFSIRAVRVAGCLAPAKW